MILNKPSWKIIIFSPVNEWHATAFAGHKADTFVMHQWCPLYRDSTVASTTRWVQPKILVLIINLFSLNFISVKIEGEKVNSSQNECTLGGGGGGARKMNEDEQGGGGGEGVKTWESWANILFECPLSCVIIEKNLYLNLLLTYQIFLRVAIKFH